MIRIAEFGPWGFETTAMQEGETIRFTPNVTLVMRNFDTMELRVYDRKWVFGAWEGKAVPQNAEERHVSL